MWYLRRASMLCVVTCSLGAMTAGLDAQEANRCFNDSHSTRTLPGGGDYPNYPGENPDLGACGSLELNASALGIVGMPGSPFFTTVFQRMMTPAGETGGGAAPLGYAGQSGP
ncbi:MAG: hypothetical protein K0R27_3495 [Xanthobacteraceae bacterium]|jgi:hypothetical protein|nr:hypothetical protein [Xanthobacteraceae bacterium]